MGKISGRPNKISEWTDQKKWLMGVAAALLVATLTGGSAYLFREVPLSDRERTAVFALIKDVRANPIYLSALYQHKHAFIDDSWRKLDPNDSYFESAEVQISLIHLGLRMGRHHDALSLLSPRHGTAIVRGGSLDLFRVNGQFRGSATVVASQPIGAGSADLDLAEIPLYSSAGRLLPREVLKHLEDLNLPASIREGLAPLSGVGTAVSFRRALASKEDLLLVSINTRLVEEGKEELPISADTGVFVHGGKGAALRFIDQSMELALRIQAWADKHSIDLGSDSVQHFARAYR